MLETLIWLVGFQLAGEFITRLVGSTLPGPVLGMLMLFATLCIRRSIPDAFREHVPLFLRNLSLLYIPAGVGAVFYIQQYLQYGWQLAATLVIGTLITLVATGLVLKLLLLAFGRDEDR